MTHADRLVGSWKLVSIYGESTGGEVFYPYGEDPVGLLMYDPPGNMSAVLMRRGRPRFASGDMANGTPQELKEAFEGFDAYCGTFTVDVAKGTVTHHVAASRFPNWEGTDQVRHFELAGDVLRIYSAPILARGTEWTVHVVWERGD
jgi:hypothetical protein